MSEGRKKLRLRQAKKNQKAKECRRKWAAFTIKMEMDIMRIGPQGGFHVLIDGQWMRVRKE